MAVRLRNENDLSDITWAMCEACPSFKQAFINVFFQNIDTKDVKCFVREKSVEVGRYDFHFIYQKKPYAIENKIYDRNHHFGQYDVEQMTREAEFMGNVEKSNLGYITNYPFQKEGYTIHTWDEIPAVLNDIDAHGIEKEMINAYAQYLTDVCSIYTTNKPMDINAIVSINTFINGLNKIITKQGNEYSTIPGKTRTECNYIGKEFRLQMTNLSEIKGLFVLDECMGEAHFKILLPCNQDMYREFQSKFNNQQLTTEGWWWIMSEDEEKTFKETDSVDGQKDILNNFYDKVIADIVKRLK